MKSERLFCLSLETGAIVVAVIEMFFSSMSLISGVTGLQKKDYVVSAILNSTNNHSDKSRESFAHCEFLENKKYLLYHFISAYEVILYVAVVLAVINIVTEICLIFGSVKVCLGKSYHNIVKLIFSPQKRHLYLVPWLFLFGVYFCICLLCCVLLICFNIFLLCIGNLSSQLLNSSLAVVVLTALYFYIWICIRTLYSRIECTSRYEDDDKHYRIRNLQNMQ
ncbi:hypothetical protein ACFFRR_003380 [Megaselia abdita]